MLEKKKNQTCFLLIDTKSKYIVGKSYVSIYFTAFLGYSLILDYSVYGFSSGYKSDIFARAGKYTSMFNIYAYIQTKINHQT